MKKLMYSITIGIAAACSLSAITAFADDSVTVTDVLGREVTVDLPIENAYLGFYYENFLTIVGPDAFTKVGSTSLYDTEGFYNTLSDIYREDVPGYADMIDVGSTFRDDFDLEKLIETDCDCAILGAYQYNGLGEDKVKVLEDAGIPVVVINYSDFSEDAKDKSTEILGKLFQVEDRANEILDDYHKRLDFVKDRVAKATENGKKTTFHEWCSSISSFSEIGSSDGPDSCLGSYLNIAGADDISYEVFEKDPDTNGVLDKEYILEKDPEYWFVVGGEAKDSTKDIVLTGYNITEDQTLASCENLISSRPGFETLTAVKEGNIYFLDNGMIRTMRDSILTEYLAKILYPEYFEDVDPIQEWADFSEKYMPDLPTDGVFFYHYVPEQ